MRGLPEKGKCLCIQYFDDLLPAAIRLLHTTNIQRAMAIKYVLVQQYREQASTSNYVLLAIECSEQGATNLMYI